MDLEDIANMLSVDQVSSLQYLGANKRLKKVKEDIEKQTVDAQEIFKQYTKNMFVEQEIKINEHLKVTFRTLAPFCVDEAIDYAADFDTVVMKQRALPRRRLAYGLIAVNGEVVGHEPPNESYAVALSAGAAKTLKESLSERADKVWEYLEVNFMADKISEAFGMWETTVWGRIEGTEDVGEVIKNYTRDRTKEQ